MDHHCCLYHYLPFPVIEKQQHGRNSSCTQEGKRQEAPSCHREKLAGDWNAGSEPFQCKGSGHNPSNLWLLLFGVDGADEERAASGESCEARLGV